jgi:hypothetical protein
MYKAYLASIRVDLSSLSNVSKGVDVYKWIILNFLYLVQTFGYVD